jgi:hypothetical protein
MATKKKRPVRRAANAGRRRVAAKRAAPKRRSSAARRRATGSASIRKKRASKSTTVRRKERKLEEARHRLIDAEKLAVEQLPKKAHPATKKRGADPHVPSRSKRKHSSNSGEQKLEQGLEESMAGSDPVSVTLPAKEPEDHAEAGDDEARRI